MTASNIIKVIAAVCILDGLLGGATAQQAQTADDIRAEPVFPVLRPSDTGLGEDLDGGDFTRGGAGGLRIPASVVNPGPDGIELPPPAGPPAPAIAGDPVAVDDGELDALLESDPLNPELRSGYEPLGIRAGSFIIYPAIETGLQYTDNALLSETGRRDDLVYNIAPELRVESDWSRHSARVSVSSSHDLYQDNTSEDSDEFSARGNVRVDITEATRLNLEGGYSFEQEERGSAEVPNNAEEEPNETTWDAAAWISHRFNRLIATVRGDVEINEFEEASVAGGGSGGGSDRDYYETGASLRLGYEVSPALQPFVETGYSVRHHDREVDRNGFRRDSDGYSVAAGVAVDTGPILRGEISVGYEVREFDDRALEDIEDVTFNANLIWSPTALTTVRLTGGTDINETSVSGSPGSLERTVGINLAHSFAYNITGDVGLTYANTTYRGSDIEEDDFELSVGLDYLLNRNVIVRAGYAYTRFETTQANSDYDVNTFRVGVKVQK